MTRRFAYVFARGGSKGVPGKNIRLLGGRPLIAYPIETALATGLFERIIVSTDSEEIAEVANRHGAETPFMRPAELATDEASEWLAWRHALRATEALYGMPDTFVSLPATAPFRNIADVQGCIARLETNATTDIVITARPAERSPYFNMVKLDERNHAHLVIQPESNVVRRQDTPTVFDVTTVAYAARPEFILKSNGLWEGSVGMVEVPAERALDIDTPFDFFIAECIAQARPGVHLI
jgi:CMP-N-acetylneuraminic acid synthetase